MKTRVSHIFTIIAVFVLTACALAQAPATPTLAPTDTTLPLPTLTYTPLPTATNTSTPTLTPTITPNPTPTITPIPERKGVIYFASDREGSFDIFELDLSEGVEHRVTTDSAKNEYFPHQSPDGKWLSYWSKNPHNESVFSLVILNLTNSEEICMYKALGWSTWSPDSQEIAFVLWTFDIFVLPMDKSESMRVLLFTDDTAEYYPAWSPDGKTIAYVRMEGDQAKIYLIGSDGENNRSLFKDDQVGYSPAWSPDGKMIAFISGDQTESQVYVVNVDGSGMRQLTSGPGLRDDPTWSPDGGRIAFWSNQDGDSEIFAILLDGSGLVQLTENEFYDENPSWSAK